jgi:hypothetical protein
MISADCFEEYLRDHTASDVERQFTNRKDIEYIMALRLKRAKFIEEYWK